MADMLVKLYTLPSVSSERALLLSRGILIKRAIAPERSLVRSWVQNHFSEGWADECDIAFTRIPISCFIAFQEKEILGFACYEATFRGFFGPIGVSENLRGQGIGKSLLLTSLHAMYDEGYLYAIIGGVGPSPFYKKVLGAIEIEGSSPGGYLNMLKKS
ncbi:MAG: GNAT family N-acetyltransferase [Candidatus Ratteibacteria bacterium]